MKDIHLGDDLEWLIFNERRCQAKDLIVSPSGEAIFKNGELGTIIS